MVGRCTLNAKIEVDHIGGNKKNNAIENLQVLCVWCHRAKTLSTILQRPTIRNGVIGNTADFESVKSTFES